MGFNHYSVLLAETVEQLNVRPDGTYVDGTLGGGGHAHEICRRLTTGHLYGTDQDEAAVAAAGSGLPLSATGLRSSGTTTATCVLY